jgi:hypothetical protein
MSSNSSSYLSRKVASRNDRQMRRLVLLNSASRVSLTSFFISWALIDESKINFIRSSFSFRSVCMLLSCLGVVFVVILVLGSVLSSKASRSSMGCRRLVVAMICKKETRLDSRVM